MSLDSFNERINRITNKTHYSAADMARGEGGTAVLRYSSPLVEAPGVRRYYKMVLLGLVLGLIAGVLVSGVANPEALWGPGTVYHAHVKLPATAALVLSPVLAVLGCMLQNRLPGLFYATSAYFPAVIAAALYA